MKTKLLLPILCACSLFKMQAQEWGYGFIDESIYMRNICTQGLDTVYIVGNNGLIARSTDQGETWEKQYFPNKAALNDMMFVDYHTGFAVGEQGTILKTTDAGETWKQIMLDVSSHINAIAATGSNNIWAVGNNSLVLHSTDAGETWEQVNILPENNRRLLDIAFRGNLGYFTGDYFTVYKTEDFGVTWNKQTIIELSDPIFVNSTRTHSINIMENKTYLSLDVYIYSTENQTNWIYGGNHGASTGNLFFLSDNVGYFVCSSVIIGGYHYGTISISKITDSGEKWEMIERRTVYVDYSMYPAKIKMINETLGYAIFSQILLKIPEKIPVKIKEIRDNTQLYLFQIGDNELVLKSVSNPIKTIEIFDTLGKKLIYERLQNSAWETNINIGNLHRSVYLIKVIHDNNTVSIDKFLIR